MKTLIEKLEEYRSRYFDEVTVAEVIVDDCIDIVKQHPEWIPCSERLPEHGKKCLVANSVEMLVGLYDRNLKEWFCGEIREGWNIIDGVTHWCELPQPPSEVQNG